MSFSIDHNALYRLPWNYADNGISWLEPTSVCNMRCEGCYRDTRHGSHKSLEEVRSDLEVFHSLRKSDCMSITGGDPLCHPQITEIVRISRDMGWKPIVNTNGMALTETMLQELKKAGVFGFTFHVDTSQNRPHWNGKTEAEHNELRLQYARMLEKAGGIACSFNATVSEKTLPEVPELVRWAQKHARIVHTMVFILFRSPDLTGTVFDAFANGRLVTFDSMYEEPEWGKGKTLYSEDVAARIKQADPLYEASAYLNGTADPRSLKWLLATRVVFNGKVMGYVSPRFQELVQTIYHLWKGKYLSYTRPRFNRSAKLSAFLAAVVDKKMRRIFFRILGEILKNPFNFFRKAYFQSFMIIQPVNILPDGRQDMCDSCPDITVHEGKLVWSCRLEEMTAFGTFITAVPKRPEAGNS
ncbi:MAG: radical SAM protein [Candidatus Aminicenantales bacterium]